MRTADTRIRRILLAALAAAAHHVTRDVHAEVSGGGVARVGDLIARLGLDVADAVRHVADPRAPTRALDAGERLRMLGRESVQDGDFRGRREDRHLAATD